MSGPKNDTPKEAPATKKTKAQAQEPANQPKPKPAGPSQTAQATAAVSGAVSVVRERLVAGEQLVLTAAGVIVLVYLIFQFLLDYRIFASNFTVVLAVLTVLAIWVHRWGHYDFGSAYRIIIGALGISLTLFALMNLLGWARAGGGAGEFLRLLGLIIFWISGVVAGYGAWLVFRTRED